MDRYQGGFGRFLCLILRLLGARGCAMIQKATIRLDVAF